MANQHPRVTIPSIIGPCPVCEGAPSVLCTVCRDVTHVCYVNNPGQIDLGPIVFTWEIAGILKASQRLGLTATQVHRGRQTASQLFPREESTIWQIARRQASAQGLETTSERIMAAMGEMLACPDFPTHRQLH